MRFEDYSLCPELKRNLLEMGLRRPTDIQFKTIPSILKGEDVLAIAQTGTGKTAAFAIPAIQGIHNSKSSKRTEGIQCLILEPTRELAQQVGEVMASLASHTRTSVFSLHGGVEQEAQITRLQRGIDILVTTPGRMFDLASQGHLDLSGVSLLILDEADHMLDLGFINDITYVKKLLPKQHQTVFMSATIKPEIKKTAYSLVRSNAIRIQLSPRNPVSRNVFHYQMPVVQDQKRFVLEQIIRDNPNDRVLVFVRTRIRAERVAAAMHRVEIPATVIHGDMPQTERDHVLSTFRGGEGKLLIATDVSARGIDIPGVSLVINYDLPEKPENYVHRVGRTGRGTKKGSAIAFCAEEEAETLAAIETFLGHEIAALPFDRNAVMATVDLMARTAVPASQVFSELESLVTEQHLSTRRRPPRSSRKKK